MIMLSKESNFVFALGRKLASQRSLLLSLASLYGLNFVSAGHLLSLIGVSHRIRNGEAHSSHWSRLQILIEQINLENKLRLRLRSHLETLKKQSSQRSLRLKQGLPSRGQRSHTNARTARRLGRTS